MTLLLLRSCIMWLLTFQKFSQATRQSFNWVWKAKKTGPSRLTVSRMIIARSWFLNTWRTTARQSVCVFFKCTPNTFENVFLFFYLADLMEDAHFLLMWNGLFFRAAGARSRYFLSESNIREWKLTHEEVKLLGLLPRTTTVTLENVESPSSSSLA